MLGLTQPVGCATIPQTGFSRSAFLDEHWAWLAAPTPDRAFVVLPKKTVHA